MTVLATQAGLISNLELTLPLALIVAVLGYVGWDWDTTRRRRLDQAEHERWRDDQRRVPPVPPAELDEEFAVDFFDGAELYEELERTAS